MTGPSLSDQQLRIGGGVRGALVLRSRKRRRVHHKVKTGCRACKVRRQKCDEQKPICSGCSRYSTECFYISSTQPLLKGEQSLRTGPVNTVLSSALSAITTSTSQISELNFGDLELMHQYITSTCMVATTQRPEVTARIQTTIPQLAQAFPFLMHGILAMAATHLSRLRPLYQAHYAMLSTRNHTSAIPKFRIALQNLNEENHQALVVYSKTLLWCSFASCETSDRALCIPRRQNDWLPEWFCLLRGSCQVVEFSRRWIKDGPHNLQKLDSDFNYSTSPNDHQILALANEVLPRVNSALCANVLSALREAFARAALSHHNTPARNAMNSWVGQLSDEFMDLLQEKEPWALVALAYFCVLVQQSETVWFMKGHATRLLLSIIDSLDPSWLQLIRWPCEQLGVDLDLLAPK